MKKTQDYRKGWFTHIHHLAPVIEWSDNIEERFEFIRTSKRENERELRAALIIRVPDELIPVRLHKACAAYRKACAVYGKAALETYNKAYGAYGKACPTYYEACAAYHKACAAHDKALADYNKALADYEWESIYDQIKLANSPWDGHTIFSRGKGIEVILSRSER